MTNRSPKTITNSCCFFNKFGIYHSWISRWKEEVKGVYPEQVIYYDNLFRTNKREKLLGLIEQN